MYRAFSTTSRKLPWLKSNPRMLWCLEDDENTFKICYSMLKISGKLLKNIPYKFQTNEMCMYALSKDVNALKYVNPKLLSKRMCDYAIIVEPNTKKYVPEKFI